MGCLQLAILPSITLTSRILGKGWKTSYVLGRRGVQLFSLRESNSNPNLKTALFASRGVQHLSDAGATEISHSTHLCPTSYFRNGGASDMWDRDREHGGTGIPENLTMDL